MSEEIKRMRLDYVLKNKAQKINRLRYTLMSLDDQMQYAFILLRETQTRSIGLYEAIKIFVENIIKDVYVTKHAAKAHQWEKELQRIEKIENEQEEKIYNALLESEFYNMPEDECKRKTQEVFKYLIDIQTRNKDDENKHLKFLIMELQKLLSKRKDNQ